MLLGKLLCPQPRNPVQKLIGVDFDHCAHSHSPRTITEVRKWATSPRYCRRFEDRSIGLESPVSFLSIAIALPTSAAETVHRGAAAEVSDGGRALLPASFDYS
jgi:hypothetical protein